MRNLLRFTLMVIVIFAAMLLTLMVAGVIDSAELWNNFSKVIQIIGIFFVASAVIMFLAKK